MCRLFGLIANKDVDAEFSFLKSDTPFRELGKKNSDGYGIGYYLNGKAKIFKEPISAWESSEFLIKSKQIISKIIISHVRYSTQGKRTIENTHPFICENWIFAHNGNIDIKDMIKKKLNTIYKNKILGQTDSEVFFYWILQNIKDTQSIVDGIKNAVSFIEKNRREGTSSLNFILTNGKKLFALKKAFNNENYYSLFYLIRDPNKISESNFYSKKTTQLISSKGLMGEKAILVCSEKLTNDENWIEIKNNTLLEINKNLMIKNYEV